MLPLRAPPPNVRQVVTCESSSPALPECWVARPPNGSAFDEDSPTNPGPASLRPSIEPAIQAEQIAREAGGRAGYSVAVLRCGMFDGADDPLTRQLGQALRARQMPIVDSG